MLTFHSWCSLKQIYFVIKARNIEKNRQIWHFLSCLIQHRPCTSGGAKIELCVTGIWHMSVPYDSSKQQMFCAEADGIPEIPVVAPRTWELQSFSQNNLKVGQSCLVVKERASRSTKKMLTMPAAHWQVPLPRNVYGFEDEKKSRPQTSCFIMFCVASNISWTISYTWICS